MGQIFSHSDRDNDASALKRSPSNSANAALLKQTISQNMRLSKSKVSSLLKANHMNYSIVHRNHFYNTLPHVFPPVPPVPFCPVLKFSTSLFLSDCYSYWSHWLMISTLERPIYLEPRRRDYSISTTRKVKLWNPGSILPMKSLASTGTGGSAINGIIPGSQGRG